MKIIGLPTKSYFLNQPSKPIQYKDIAQYNKGRKDIASFNLFKGLLPINKKK